MDQSTRSEKEFSIFGEQNWGERPIFKYIYFCLGSCLLLRRDHSCWARDHMGCCGIKLSSASWKASILPVCCTISLVPAHFYVCFSVSSHSVYVWTSQLFPLWCFWGPTHLWWWWWESAVVPILGGSPVVAALVHSWLWFCSALASPWLLFLTLIKFKVYVYVYLYKIILRYLIWGKIIPMDTSCPKIM